MLLNSLLTQFIDKQPFTVMVHPQSFVDTDLRQNW